MAAKADFPRKIALDLLSRFEKAGSERLKADGLLQTAFAQYPDLTEQDRAFARALVSGTLRQWLRYDEWIKLLTGKPLKNLLPLVRCLLRLGFFQLEGLSQVPAYAAINSTVELAKGCKNSPKTVKFINAVLREAHRRIEGEGFAIPDAVVDLPNHLLARFGWPVNWSQRLLITYTPEAVLAMAEAAQHPALMSIRVNTLKIDVPAYQVLLTEQQIPFEPLPDLPEGFILPAFSGSPRQLPGYEVGLFYVQDAASMWVSRWLDPQPGERVLDLCAAPGSKTTHLAALMNHEGHILAIEPKVERLALLKENLQRLGVRMVETWQGEAQDYALEAEDGFDKVLVDAPCSGTGTLRRHPEILPQLKRLDVSAYNTLQLALLNKGFDSLKPGGVLVYSTCSILPAENRELVQRFLMETPAASLLQEEQRLIHQKADGFYAARLMKSL